MENILPDGIAQFDHGEPTKPEGDTGLPSWDAPHQQIQPDIQAPLVTDIMKAPNEEWMQQIRMLPAAQQETILAWWPYAWARPSEFIGGKYIMTLPALLHHADEYTKKQRKIERQAEKQSVVKRREEREQQKAEKSGRGTAWKEWQEQCRLRKVWIEEQAVEWRSRLAQRAAAIKQWDLYCNEAREKLRSAKLTPLPPQPE